MASYELDHEQNALSADVVRIRIEGMLDIEQAEELVEEMETMVQKASDDFVFINDIREFEPLPQEGVNTIEKGKKILHNHDASAVIRIVGSSVVGKMQFERPGDEYSFFEATVNDLDEAHELIDEWEQRD
ncbi:hypothetical protein ACFQJ7_17350 [Halovenus rubra]|uniref:Uncharacterized protein n=2 Tax=Halovenus rubra TaxID=869890 RepID=A0ABD5X9P9_9EURY|nr:hypothetical protein [Halovenus rubra]